MELLNDTRAELGLFDDCPCLSALELIGPEDDFQASSKELEDELERELLVTERQQSELKDRIKRLEVEKEESKVCRLAAASTSE